jgi:hypothetical protein
MLLVQFVLFVLVSTTITEDTALNTIQYRLNKEDDTELILEPDSENQISVTKLRVTCRTVMQQERIASHIPSKGVHTIRIKRQSRCKGVT